MRNLGMFGIWEIMLFLLALSGIILTIMALLDILKSEFKGNHKIVWILIVLFVQFFGAILYFKVGKKLKTSS